MLIITELDLPLLFSIIRLENVCEFSHAIFQRVDSVFEQLPDHLISVNENNNLDDALDRLGNKLMSSNNLYLRA